VPVGTEAAFDVALGELRDRMEVLIEAGSRKW